MAGMKAIAVLTLLVAAPAIAQPLTVRTGETWIFSVKDGQPVDARKANTKARPGKGQMMVAVRAMLGTNMSVINNSPVAYTFHAELLQGGKATAARPCTLPANNRAIFEQWQQKADAVRIGNFTPTGEEGHC